MTTTQSGVSATSAILSGPYGVAIANGVLSFTELDHTVKQVSLTSSILTTLGIGTLGYDGDGKQATMTEFNAKHVYPTTNGEFYIAGKSLII